MPTFEVHGIAGGYQGPGVKTVVPPRATAIVSCRLVPDMDGRKIVKIVKQFVKEKNPDVKVEAEHGLPAYQGHTEGPHPDAISYTVENGLPNMYVTEDTIRARPETIRKLYTTAIECGARRVVLTDTVGHATPAGVTALVSFMKEVVADTGEDVKIDWHGHRDRGLSIPNSIAAVRSGVDRVHACALGIGERCGNTPMDILLVNLKLLGWIDHDLSGIAEYCHLVSEATGVPIPSNYPVVGEDAFRTGTGVHAAAVIKALNKNDSWLADRVYSGVPAGEFGLEQTIEVGPMSGFSNVQYWLSSRGFPVDDELVRTVFEKAKASNRVLEDEEIEQIAREFTTSS